MSGLVTPEIESLQPYAAGKPLEELAREGVTDAIKLASNENALGPSPKAVAAAAGALATAHRYPDAAVYELRHQLAKRLQVAPEELVFGNGSNELLELLVRTFATREHHLVFGEPSFVVYRMAALAQGVPHTAVPLRDGRFDLGGMAAAVRANTCLLFIANPNNPTGSYVSRADLNQFLASVPAHVIVVLDEAYFEYATAADYPDGIQLRSTRENIVVLRTFSKAYGLASLRLGYGVCPRRLASYLDRVRAPFNANGIAQAAALAALGDEDFLQRVVQLNHRERERVTAAFEALGARVQPSQANFLFVEFNADAAELNRRLLKQGVIVRPLPGMAHALRITLGTEQENDRMLDAFRKLASGGGVA